MAKLRDITGQRFGKLTVVKQVGYMTLPSGSRRAKWLCKCDCGGQTTALATNLKSGATYSCGCTRINSDMLTAFPDIAREFDAAKNNIAIEKLASRSGRKVFWHCPLGHSYKQSVFKRVVRGQSCPYCSNRELLVGFNDLQSRFPMLAKEFDVAKNSTTPDKVIATSSQAVFWICNACAGSWRTQIRRRTVEGTGCPHCYGKARFSATKPVRCVETRIAYPSLLDAAIAMNLKSSSSIGKAAAKNTTAAGYHWEFI